MLTAVILSKDDQHRLLARMSHILMELHPSGFKTSTETGDLLAHHMTCNLGRCPDEYRDMLGKDVILKVDGFGVSDQAIAVSVLLPSEPVVHCNNAKAHITIAVNPTRGGKPKHSNEISLWFPFPKPIYVLGVFQEES